MPALVDFYEKKYKKQKIILKKLITFMYDFSIRR